VCVGKSALGPDTTLQPGAPVQAECAPLAYFTTRCTIQRLAAVLSSAKRARSITRTFRAFQVDTRRTAYHTLCYMVKYSAAELNRTFGALVDQSRRTMLARLEREDGVSVSDLAKPFAITLPAIMKHLDVLEDAGLITRSKEGRTVTVRLRPEPIRGALHWLRRYERFWSRRLDRLAAYAERQEAKASRRSR
jgi:DNA-binding transcriptional ArsR family regulator